MLLEIFGGVLLVGAATMGTKDYIDKNGRDEFGDFSASELAKSALRDADKGIKKEYEREMGIYNERADELKESVSNKSDKQILTMYEHYSAENKKSVQSEALRRSARERGLKLPDEDDDD